MKKRYILICLLGALFMLIVCVVQFIVRPNMTLLITLYMPLVIIPIGFAAFVPNWKKAVRLKEEHGWQVSNVILAETNPSYTRGSLSALPRTWYVLSFVITVAFFALAIMRYPALPDMIAGHLDANMQPTMWVEKTWWSVLMMPVLNAATLAILVMTAVFIEKVKLQIDPTKQRLSFAQHRVYRRRLGHALGFLTLIIILFMSVLGLPIIFPESPVWGAHIFWSSMFLFFIPVVVLITVQIKTGQGGCKVKIDVDEDSANNQTSSGQSAANKVNDDKYWLLGMFYHNPDDPACIIENRFGTNIGFNYARLPVKISVTIVLLGLIAMYVWLTMLLF
jgi:uncharacterized membrane protein